MTSSNSREMKQKLSGFKTEVAGRIGGQMVKRMIEYAERNMNGGSNMMK